MKRRSGEIQVFSMSFLDVLSCALGGTLLLLLLVQEGQQQQTEAQQEAMKQMIARMDDGQTQMRKAIEASERARKEADKAQREADEAARKARTAQQRADAARQQALAAKRRSAAQAKTISQLKKAKEALVGLGGKRENLVFIFDTSGSMSGKNFDYYVKHLVKLIENLDYKRFNLIDFDSVIRVWKPGRMLDATIAANKQDAVRFTRTFRAGGLTDTMVALKTAARLPGVDTVILFTDGDPLPQRFYKNRPVGGLAKAMKKERDDILAWAKSQRGRLVINTVIVGRNHTPILRQFLRQLAESTNGTVQALP